MPNQQCCYRKWMGVYPVPEESCFDCPVRSREKVMKFLFFIKVDQAGETSVDPLESEFWRSFGLFSHTISGTMRDVAMAFIEKELPSSITHGWVWVIPVPGPHLGVVATQAIDRRTVEILAEGPKVFQFTRTGVAMTEVRIHA